MIYLDNNATTRPDPRVVEAMRPFLLDAFGNASSVHRFGRAARTALDQARDRTAAILGVAPGEIVFTATGSEANALAIFGVVHSNKARGKHIVASRIEHPSILDALKRLGEQGAQVDWVPVEASGRVDAARFCAALRADTALASLMLANNETGVLQPVESVGAACRERGIPFHVDAVQAFGKVRVRPAEIPCDLLSISGHKFHGPKGASALFVRRGLPLLPLVAGHQERGRRGGTEDVAAAVGLSVAAELAAGGLEARVDALRDRFEARVREELPEARVNGDGAPRVGNTSNLLFPGVDGEAVLIALDLEGIAVSTGAACSSGSLSPSHVLLAMGLSSGDAHGSIRVSLSRETTEEEVDVAARSLVAAVRGSREVAARP